MTRKQDESTTSPFLLNLQNLHPRLNPGGSAKIYWPIPLAWKSDRRRLYFTSVRGTATPSTSVVAGRNPPDWWDQSDA